MWVKIFRFDSGNEKQFKREPKSDFDTENKTGSRLTTATSTKNKRKKKNNMS